jgi:hypothetical protein
LGEKKSRGRIYFPVIRWARNDSGDFQSILRLLPVFFSQPPTRDRAFIANKRQSAIRPSDHRVVEALFRDDFAFDLADC